MPLDFRELYLNYVYGVLAVMTPLLLLSIIPAYLQGISLWLLIASPFLMVINAAVSALLVAAIILLGAKVRSRLQGQATS